MEKLKPLEKIVVPSNDAIDPVRNIKKGLPVVDAFRSDLEKLAQMLFIKLPLRVTPKSLVEAMITQLECVPYIPYPVSLSTVDMVGVTYKMVNGKRRPFILLGRRSATHLWQFPGGFRDPRETDEEAAQREYIEEVSIDVPIANFKRIGQLFVDDRRYKDTPHKITTAIHIVRIKAKDAKKAVASDDIFEVQWFDLEYLRVNRDIVVRDVHTNLFNFIEKHIK